MTVRVRWLIGSHLQTNTVPRGEVAKVLCDPWGDHRDSCPAFKKRLDLPLADRTTANHKAAPVSNIQVHGIVAHHRRPLDDPSFIASVNSEKVLIINMI
jgi:hypothetical protein